MGGADPAPASVAVAATTAWAEPRPMALSADIEGTERSGPAARPIPPAAPAAPGAASPWPRVVLLAGMVATAAVLLYVGRGLTFFFDEWDFLLGRRTGGLESLLAPHNEHFSLVPVIAYKVLGSIVGLEHYIAYRASVIALHGLAALLVFRLVRARLGAWEGVIAAGFLLGLGAAWEDLLWPFQIGFLGSVAAALGAMRLLDRGTRGADVGAALAVGIALASSSLGIPIVIGVAVELAARDRRDWRRPLIVLGVPVALYGLWYLGYGRSALQGENAADTPGWVTDAASAAVGAVLGQEIGPGRVLAAVAAALLLYGVARRRVALTPRLLGLGATGLAFWTFTALARADQTAPDTSRYLYLGAVALILFAAEALRGVRRPAWSLALAGAVVVAAAALNSDDLRDGGRQLRTISNVVAAELGAVQLARPDVPADYRPDVARAPQITAGPYLAAIGATRSSPADPPGELPSAGGEARAAADRVLQELGQVNVAPRAGGERGPAAPVLEGSAGGRVRAAAGCVRLRPSGAQGTLELALPAGGLDVSSPRGPVEIRVRRFFEGFINAPVGRLPRGERATVTARRDASPAGWHVQLLAGGPVSVCARGS